MNISRISALVCVVFILGWSAPARGYASAEILTSESYQYGRFEASIEFPDGSGVIGAFFLWKDGSEVEGTFWNELDFETLGFDCHLETNAYYGNPAQYHVEQTAGDPVCGTFHTFAYEWTPDYVAWLVDGEEVRRETGETAAAFRDNATEGMQFRFNVWPGDASFGGTFDPSLLPVYQRIDWVQYSSFDGSDFVLEWREDFEDDAIPPGWDLGTWDSPKAQSTHFVENAGVVDGVLVLALTADDALGIPGVTPTTGAGGVGGTGGSTGTETTGSASIGGTGGTTGTESTTSTSTSTGTGTGTLSSSSLGASSVGGGTAVGGAASTTSSSVSSTTTSTGTATSTSNAVVSSTAAATTTGATTTNATALTGTTGSGGGAASAADDSAGCACRAAGYGETSGWSRNFAGFALLALGASLRIRRRSKR